MDTATTAVEGQATPAPADVRHEIRVRPWVVPVVLFVLAASLRCGLVARQGLWVDEVFSLAIATGHSIEHPAKIANRQPMRASSPSAVFRRRRRGAVRPA